MDKTKTLATRKALEEIVGPFDYDDPNFDDKRAFILFGAKDPNATWEEVINRAPDPEIRARIEAEGAKRAAELEEYIWMTEWEEPE